MVQPEMAYEEHAKRCEETDFWGQVRRTVNGKAISEEQIALIVAQMRSLLDVSPRDVFLDICCGNGALTARVFEGAAGGIGVDISSTLIEVARRHFSMPGVTYVEADAVDWLLQAAEDSRFTKALLYGSINFIPPQRVSPLFRSVRERFPQVEKFVVGNIADRERLHDFFSPETYVPGVEDDPASPIGYWWTRDALLEVARDGGWNAEVVLMPEAYVARHYRFDLVLKRI